MRLLYFWHFHLYPYICQPLRYRALPNLTSRCGANFAGASKSHETIRSLTHKPHYIFLKTTTIHTYHGISIAIPRYTAVQLPAFVYMTSSLSYLLCMTIEPHDSQALPFTSSLPHDALDLCTSCYTSRGIQCCMFYFLQFCCTQKLRTQSSEWIHVCVGSISNPSHIMGRHAQV